MRHGIIAEEEDTSRKELEVRMLQIEEHDRSDPKLVELDSLAAELEDRERRGLLAEAHFDPDWRTELGEGEEIFVRNPDGMEHFLKKMRTRMLMKYERAEKVCQLADKLLQDRVIAVPLQVWQHDAHTQMCTHCSDENEGNGARSLQIWKESDADPDKEPEPEEILINRLGFIFLAYRVEFW